MRPLALLGALLLVFSGPALADEFYCEVMDVQGTVTLTNESSAALPLQEGDLLKAEDVVEVAADSFVDLAYDKEWNNITRVEENSKLRIRTLVPSTSLALESGGVYAKLKQLPKESTFDVQTPTAIASARGTEFRTAFTSGETQIFNVSDSDVYVYGIDESGAQQVAEPVILKNSERTEVVKRGVAPVAPHRMEVKDFHPVTKARERIEGKIQDNIAKGRFGKIQDIHQMENARQGTHERKPVKTLSGDEARQAVDNIVRDKDIPQSQESSMHPKEGNHEDARSEAKDVFRSDEGGRRAQTLQDLQRKSDKMTQQLSPEQQREVSGLKSEVQSTVDSMMQGIRGEDNQVDPQKVEQLKQKVAAAMSSLPAEQRQMLENAQRQINSAAEKFVKQRTQAQGQGEGQGDSEKKNMNDERPNGFGQPYGPDDGRSPDQVRRGQYEPSNRQGGNSQGQQQQQRRQAQGGNKPQGAKRN